MLVKTHYMHKDICPHNALPHMTLARKCIFQYNEKCTNVMITTLSFHPQPKQPQKGVSVFVFKDLSKTKQDRPIFMTSLNFNWYTLLGEYLYI